MSHFYPIGTPGQPWTDDQKRAWFDTCSMQRSYREEVLDKIDSIAALNNSFEVFAYGSLPLDPERYPLQAVRVTSEVADAPWVLITGGVHGYETSGVQGALEFLANHAADYRDRVNMLVAPCVSPWGYEVINRWNPNAIDPNRNFVADSPSEEAASLMALVAEAEEEAGVGFVMHIDLHETTDTDESEFRPALASRDGEPFKPGLIPDGFYTVGDTDNPQPEFQAAIIAGVEKVTHIAPPDDDGQIIGEDQTQHGVINYPLKDWGLCGNITNAQYTSTTEVYPDSPKATPEICIKAQIAALQAALAFVLA